MVNGCTLSRRGAARAELYGSTFKETGDVKFIKLILGELSRKPLTTREAKASFEGKPYKERTVEDFLYACENLRLLWAFRRRQIWQPTPYGYSWISLAPNYREPIGLIDKIFLIRHLLMIDSNNCGLWLTSVLRCIDKAKEQGRQGRANLETIKQLFADKLVEHGERRLVGNALSHKVEPILGWARDIDLVEEDKHAYRLTDAGRVIASMHERFLARGYEAFRQEGGAWIADALSNLGIKKARQAAKISEQLFESLLAIATKRLRTISRRPIDIPSLRTVCCCMLLQQGVGINDEQFDGELVHLCNRYYYKYVLLKASRSMLTYPFQGIYSGGSFYFFDIVSK